MQAGGPSGAAPEGGGFPPLVPPGGAGAPPPGGFPMRGPPGHLPQSGPPGRFQGLQPGAPMPMHFPGGHRMGPGPGPAPGPGPGPAPQGMGVMGGAGGLGPRPLERAPSGVPPGHGMAGAMPGMPGGAPPQQGGGMMPPGGMPGNAAQLSGLQRAAGAVPPMGPGGNMMGPGGHGVRGPGGMPMGPMANMGGVGANGPPPGQQPPGRGGSQMGGISMLQPSGGSGMGDPGAGPGGGLKGMGGGGGGGMVGHMLPGMSISPPTGGMGATGLGPLMGPGQGPPGGLGVMGDVAPRPPPAPAFNASDFPSLGDGPGPGAADGAPQGHPLSSSLDGAAGGLPMYAPGAHFGALHKAASTMQQNSDFRIEKEEFPALGGGGPGGAASGGRRQQPLGKSPPDGPGLLGPGGSLVPESNHATTQPMPMQRGNGVGHHGGPAGPIAGVGRLSGSSFSPEGGLQTLVPPMAGRQVSEGLPLGAFLPGQDGRRGSAGPEAGGSLPGLPGAAELVGADAPAPAPGAGNGAAKESVNRFGLMGLLGVIGMEEPDLTTLALGTDLSTLGLPLDSPKSLYPSFLSPWAEGPTQHGLGLRVPECYMHPAPRLQAGHFRNFPENTLFFVFFSMPQDEAQLMAAEELCSRGWSFHKELKSWICRAPHTELASKTADSEKGSYLVFDTNAWEIVRKDSFVVRYEHIERPPSLPK